MTRRLTHCSIALLGAALALTVGCNDSNGTDPQPTELEQLTEAMAPFENFDTAVNAGYATAITTCWYHRDLGAMGYHYGKVALIDGTPALLEPEALMYEPQADQSLRFVGVEYIVPFDAWTGTTPPSLLGQQFSRNEALGLYTLHAWVGTDNPSGTYSPWNPAVSCDDAEESDDMASDANARLGHSGHGI